MAPILSLFSLFFHFLLHLNPAQGSGGKILFEDGYTVSTVLDGNKVKVNLYSILPQSSFSNQLIVLDSAASTFYTVSLPTTSQESVIKRLAGNGQQGYADGDLNSAMFNKPKSFAVDYRGNVYVADKNNFAIRKITKSGVTTIAGGYSHKIGHDDGPTRNASFSSDFELVFIPKKCALMVSDRGNRLIRQINLKAEDCTAHSGSGLGMSSAWLLGVGLSCLFGLIVGFIIRPYVIPHEIQTSSLQRDMESMPNESGETNNDTLLRHQKRSLSLMDCDVLNSHQLDKAQTEADQLMNLISFDGCLSLSENANEIMEQEAKRENTEISTGKNRKIDGMIRANIASFAEKSPGVSLEESSECSLSSVKRRLNAGNGFF
ncbi:NHL domain-containing protein [Abeliophyllum distichum]|uniref:NHL domain-containing protein n=1 Tax=Abeliophyllum distichum TaxID=126358 RepID=A0ABD1NTV0_9LAMI